MRYLDEAARCSLAGLQARRHRHLCQRPPHHLHRARGLRPPRGGTTRRSSRRGRDSGCRMVQSFHNSSYMIYGRTRHHGLSQESSRLAALPAGHRERLEAFNDGAVRGVPLCRAEIRISTAGVQVRSGGMRVPVGCGVPPHTQGPGAPTWARGSAAEGASWAMASSAAASSSVSAPGFSACALKPLSGSARLICNSQLPPPPPRPETSAILATGP